MVRAPSNWEPNTGNNTISDATINFLKSHPIQGMKEKMKSNVTLLERKPIGKIRDNKNILIKDADKGSAVVIMNKNYYVQKIKEIINDGVTYETVERNMDLSVMNRVRKLTISHKEVLTTTEIKYLTNFDCSTSLFYGLPKIHKSNLIRSAIEE